MPSNEVSFTVDFKNVKLVQEIIKKFTDEATRLEERFRQEANAMKRLSRNTLTLSPNSLFMQ